MRGRPSLMPSESRPGDRRWSSCLRWRRFADRPTFVIRTSSFCHRLRVLVSQVRLGLHGQNSTVLVLQPTRYSWDVHARFDTSGCEQVAGGGVVEFKALQHSARGPRLEGLVERSSGMGVRLSWTSTILTAWGKCSSTNARRSESNSFSVFSSASRSIGRSWPFASRSATIFGRNCRQCCSAIRPYCVNVFIMWCFSSKKIQLTKLHAFSVSGPSARPHFEHTPPITVFDLITIYASARR